jgi:hypothetical protein
MTKRYVTVLATFEVPDDDVWDQIIDREVYAMVVKLGLQLAPCDFTIDVDTLTDGLRAEYGTVTLLDMNPPIVHPRGVTGSIEGTICIEATCGKCGERYNPEFPTDEHFQRYDESECGGPATEVRNVP